MKTLVVSFYGGPCTGKTKMTHSVMAQLKEQGIKCEMVPEYAKGLVWQNSTTVLANQIYIFGKQHQYLVRSHGQVEVIVTDAPLLNTLVYSKAYSPNRYETLMKLAAEEYKLMNNLDILLQRAGPYDPVGRYQDEAGAKAIDDITLEVLDQYNPGGYHEILSDISNTGQIVELIKSRL